MRQTLVKGGRGVFLPLPKYTVFLLERAHEDLLLGLLAVRNDLFSSELGQAVLHIVSGRPLLVAYLDVVVLPACLHESRKHVKWLVLCETKLHRCVH